MPGIEPPSTTPITEPSTLDFDYFHIVGCGNHAHFWSGGAHTTTRSLRSLGWDAYRGTYYVVYRQGREPTPEFCPHYQRVSIDNFVV